MTTAPIVEAFIVSQPHSPDEPTFIVPPALVERFEMIARPDETEDNPLSRFAAAVLFEAEMPGPPASDAELRSRADELALADKTMREQPGIPFMMLNKSFLECGITSPYSSLYFSNSMTHPSADESDQIMVVTRGAMKVTAEISDDDKVELDSLEDGWSESSYPFVMQMPVHALTPRNLNHAEEAAGNFLKEGSLIVGKPAIEAFFQAVGLQDREMEKPRPLTERQQSIADQARSILHFFRVLP